MSSEASPRIFAVKSRVAKMLLTSWTKLALYRMERSLEVLEHVFDLEGHEIEASVFTSFLCDHLSHCFRAVFSILGESRVVDVEDVDPHDLDRSSLPRLARRTS